jgi:hypothetical protein
MGNYTVQFLGQDITNYVTQWDQIEQIKDVLLSDAQFATSEINLSFDNSTGFLSPLYPGSMVNGRNWYNLPLQVYSNLPAQVFSAASTLIFDGRLKNIELSPDDRTATMVAEDVLSGLTDAIINGVQNNVNPGTAMLSLLNSAGLQGYVDTGSFINAGSAAAAAGASINYTFTQGSNTTALAAVQAIASFSSISVFVLNNTVVARVFQPYQGDGSNLRFPITDGIVRVWTQLQWDTDSFNNQVSVAFQGTGSPYISTDYNSVTQNSVTRLYEFGGSNVLATNKASARFFAQSYLARASRRRAILDLTGGLEFAGSVLGDRHWVTCASLGLNDFPMEIIEIHRHLDTDDIDLRLVGLADGNDALPQPQFQENFSAYPAGTQISSLSGWVVEDQSGGSGSTLVEPGTVLPMAVARILPASGAWDSIQYFGEQFGDIDLTCRVSIPSTGQLYCFVRAQNVSYFFPDAYYLRSDSAGNWAIGKSCGANIYDMITGSVTLGSGGAFVRILVQGLVVTAYLDGVLLGSYDFTGNVLCSSAIFATGGIAFTGIGIGTPYEVSEIMVWPLSS